MKRMLTSQLIPGMIVAKDIEHFNGDILLRKGEKLTDTWITKLNIYAIMTVYVEDTPEDSSDTSSQPAQEASTHSHLKNKTEFEEFHSNYQQEQSSVQNLINDILTHNTTLNVRELLNHSLNTVAFLNGRDNSLDMLQSIKKFDDSTFTHSLNVSLICNLFASWLHFDKEETDLVTACGLLHDIGKLTIPHSLITKPDKLSQVEYTAVQNHTLAGYNLLKSQNINEHICNAALMHHECFDGSGYPLHLKGNQIDRYARIVAIADVYDAMTAARVYRGPLCPFKVIEIFELEGLQKYDPHYIIVFLENVASTYIGSHCRLNNGQEGEIICINKNKLSKPLIQCDSEIINLAEHPELEIENLL